MRNRELLKQILEATRDLWDQDETRPDVRENFSRMLACRTPALGAEVYASPSGEEISFYHTCKSRACPSCGYRATLLWQETMRAVLPDIGYVGIGFTMPNVLWPVFTERHGGGENRLRNGRGQFPRKLNRRTDRREALKGHEGHEVTLKVHEDVAKNEIHVVSVKMGKAEMKESTKKDEMKK